MPGAGAGKQGGVADAMTPAEAVRELGRVEREAIAAGDWDALDGILERQKAMWRELVESAEPDRISGTADAAGEALMALYEVRRRNHALIEQSLREMRRRLTVAHAGSGARSAYQLTSGRAA
ncbi:MAG: hypothetical protein ACOX9R_03975 [Armatimonadota bacterium]|jgi:hypothetical protein